MQGQLKEDLGRLVLARSDNVQDAVGVVRTRRGQSEETSGDLAALGFLAAGADEVNENPARKFTATHHIRDA